MQKPSLYKNTSDTIQHIASGDKGVHTFLKGISPKVNVIAQLEFELCYFEVSVQYFNHYATETPSSWKGCGKNLKFGPREFNHATVLHLFHKSECLECFDVRMT